MASSIGVIKINEVRTAYTGTLTGNGTTSITAIGQGDTLAASLLVRSLSGTVKVTIYELTDTAELVLMEFPLVSAITSDLLTQCNATHMGNIRVDIVHSDTCDVEVTLKSLASTVPHAIESMTNSYSGSLLTATTITGAWENVLQYAEITVFAYADQVLTVYADMSTDGITTHSTNTYVTVANNGLPHKIAVFSKYFRIRIVNSSGSTATVAVQTLFMQTAKSPLSASVSTPVTDYADAAISRSILAGRTNSGRYENVPATSEGHLEVALHSPLLPFGSLHVENLTPVFQTDGVYGINTTNVVSSINASGVVTTTDSAFSCSTGVTIGGAGSLQSRRRLRYRPGQGMVVRFTALYTSPIAASYQIAGVGHPEDGVYFGYVGTVFGILYTNRGVREVQTLTVSTASTTTESITITLNGSPTSVAVTNSGSTLRTAYEISQGVYPFWDAEVIGSTVVFVSQSVGNKAGAFTLTGATTAVGTFAETIAGVAVTEAVIAQADWNTDPMDGTGNSGITLDKTKFNVYQIGIQYLGAGAINFQIEATYTGNNAEWVTVHTMRLPNSLIKTTFGNPSFPFTMSAYSNGSSGTNLTVKCGSFAGFIEGEKKTTGPRFSYTASSASVTAAAFKALLTVRNSRVFAGRTNQSVVNVLGLNAALKHNFPCTIYVFKNATLLGNPSFAQYHATSCTYLDTAATTCTIANNSLLVWSGTLGDTGNFDHIFTDELTLQPGESLTIAALSSSGNPNFVNASINTREDQ